MVSVLWSLALTWALIIGFLGLGVFRFAHSAPEIGLWVASWALWIPIQLLGLHQGAALTAIQDYHALAFLQLTGRGCAVAMGTAALLIWPGSLPAFLIALLFSDFLVAIMSAYRLRKVSVAEVGNSMSMRRCFGEAIHMGLRAYPLLFLPYLLIKMDVLIMRSLRDVWETGVYSIASQIIDIGFILPATVGALVLPGLVRGDKGPEALLALARQMAFALAGGCVVIVIFGQMLIRLIFGEEYAPAYQPLVILIPGFIALSLETVVAQYFAARGYPLFLSAFWLGAVVLNLALNLALIPRYGMLAAALSSTISYSLVFVLVLTRFQKHTSMTWHDLMWSRQGG
jgi:O-antigen/teichoic acid export membrane protein